jgi:hypothetical protein
MRTEKDYYESLFTSFLLRFGILSYKVDNRRSQSCFILSISLENVSKMSFSHAFMIY